jgi:hypothetical protein
VNEEKEETSVINDQSSIDREEEEGEEGEGEGEEEEARDARTEHKKHFFINNVKI